ERAGDVDVEIELQPLTSNNLFSIAPYHTAYQDRDLMHLQGKWMLQRGDPERYSGRGRFVYRFGTHAFQHGSQTRFLRYFAPDEQYRAGPFADRAAALEVSGVAFDPTLYRSMLAFDPERMPSV